MKMNEPMLPIRPQRLKKLLHRLIDIYSPSGKEEEILDFLHGYLKRAGLPLMLQSVDGYRHNLIVMPPEMNIRLVLLGHVDTVAAYDLEHYGYEEQGDLVVGLGAADMKGGCAAMIEAYMALCGSGHTRPPVALALVVGEEEEGDGTRRLVKDFHCPWALLGEPTDLQPCLSHYGYLEVEIVTTGKRVHASLANRRLNPIDSMLRLLLKLSQHIEDQWPQMVYNLRELSSSQAGFAVPERCNAWIDIHVPPKAPLGAITMEFEEILAREHRENPDFSGTLRFATIHGGYELPEKGPMVDTLRNVFAKHSLPWEPRSFPSHSDANLLWAAGMKPILLGCGRLEKAHAPDESVAFGQVMSAARLYFDMLISLCG
jgi:acetylornithine deacetylase